MSKSAFYRLTFVVGLAIVLVGCGGQRTLSTKQTYPVTGKVTMDGKPVAFAIVHLSPKEGKGAEATGFTDADGTFQLRTYSNNEMDGAVPGEYSVSVEPYNPVEFLGTTKPKPGEKPTQVPQERRSPDTAVMIDENTAEIPPIEL